MTDLADILHARASKDGRSEQASPEDSVPTPSSDELEQLWTELMPPESYSARRGLETFLDAVQAGAGTAADADLEFRPGGWQVDCAAVQCRRSARPP